MNNLTLNSTDMEKVKCFEEVLLETYKGEYQDVIVERLENKDLDVYTGASKICVLLSNVALKVCAYENGINDKSLNDVQDLLDKETSIYEEAKKCGVEEFFVETRFLDEVGDFLVFAQDRVKDFYCPEFRKNLTLTLEAREKLETVNSKAIGYAGFVDEFASSIINKCGEEKYLRLVEFIYNNSIRDLHTGNLGFTPEGQPVIFDYSGYTSPNGRGSYYSNYSNSDRTWSSNYHNDSCRSSCAF